MTNAMEQLYQQVILDHARDPHGRDLSVGPTGGAVDAVAGSGPGHLTGESHQVNPTCGDEVTLRVEIDAAGGGVPVLRAVHWDGQGCSISQASVSVLTDLVTGAELTEVDRLAETFRALMHSRGAGLDDDSEEALGDATAFTGVAKYPARIKCALLGWAALHDAVIRSGAALPAAPPATTNPATANPATANPATPRTTAKELP